VRDRRTLRVRHAGVSVRGIDFRPATGDLYALGSDKVVYRVNVATAIAVGEGPAFESTPGREQREADHAAAARLRPRPRRGFDIAGSSNVGYVAGTDAGRRKVTGLAAWQDQ
jgi:uncharacterized protein DUF4394